MMKRLKKISIVMCSVAVMSLTLTACAGCGKKEADAGTDSLVAVADTENKDAAEDMDAVIATEEMGTAETAETVEETNGVVPAEETETEPEETESVVIPETGEEDDEDTPASTPSQSEKPDTEPSKEPEPATKPEVTPAPSPVPTPKPTPAPAPVPEEPAVHVHTLVEEVTEATCESGKVITTKCSTCGHVEGTRTEGSGLGHDYKEILLYAATCMGPGYKEVMCTRCKAYGPGNGDIPMLPHSYYIKILVEGDCRSPQIRKEICSICGHEEPSVYDRKIHANDHVWVSSMIPIWSDEAFAMVEVERVYCSVCNMDKP